MPHWNTLIYFLIQLFLNLSWTSVFFKLESILGGLIILIFLDIFTFLTIKEFYKIADVPAFLFKMLRK